jgi:hypothetical protein
MPKYDYQKAGHGTYSVKYQPRLEPLKKVPALQNVRFG